MSANQSGALFMVAAMMAFAVEDALFKAATVQVSAGLATLVFGLIGLVIYAGLVRRAGLAVWTPVFLERTLLIRSGFELMGRLFYALALAFAPLAVTTAILQAAPLVVTLGAALVLGERVGPRRWVALAVGFGGVLLVLRPGGGDMAPAALFAVLGMVGFACRDLATRASPPEVSASQLGIPGFLTVVLAGCLILAFEDRGAGTLDPWTLGLLAAAGVMGVAAYTALTRAMRLGEVSVVAPFRYSRLLAGLLLAYIAFGERPDLPVLLGSALIVISGLYTLWRSDRAQA